MQASSIDEVIAYLGDIIQSSKESSSPLGYFAALYRNVTISVRDKIGTGYFDDDQRMALLDVTFANRYLAAYSDNKEGKPVTGAWMKAFAGGDNNSLIVLQHLLLGMNAHINLDLGISAAAVTEPDTIADLEDDFNKINTLLSTLVGEVEEDLSEIWPTLYKILKFTKGLDDLLINFLMSRVRDKAWDFANELSPLAIAARAALIEKKDKEVSLYARLVSKPGIIFSMILRIIRWKEEGDVRFRIGLLENNNQQA